MKKFDSLGSFEASTLNEDRLQSVTGGKAPAAAPTACTTNRTGDDNSRPDPS